MVTRNAVRHSTSNFRRRLDGRPLEESWGPAHLRIIMAWSQRQSCRACAETYPNFFVRFLINMVQQNSIRKFSPKSGNFQSQASTGPDISYFAFGPERKLFSRSKNSPKSPRGGLNIISERDIRFEVLPAAIFAAVGIFLFETGFWSNIIKPDWTLLVQDTTGHMLYVCLWSLWKLTPWWARPKVSKLSK